MSTFNSPEELPSEAFLPYLREYHPYLYDIESMVQEVKEGTGYGEISLTLRIVGGKVDKGSMLQTEEKIYVRRKKNRL